MNKEDSWIRTYSGGKVYFFEPEKSDIDLIDIYHSLSLLCRFNGACKVPYNVADHSILVADNVYKETCDKSLALQGLCHDFSEAFISDIPSPFKKQFEGFKEVEIRMEEWLSKRFGFQFPFDPIIKHHDLRALSTEMRDLMLIVDNQHLPEPYPEKIIPLDWQQSKIFFAQRFQFYRGV